MTKYRQNSKTKSRGHNLTNVEQNTVLEVMTEFAHYKGDFWGANV